MTVESQKDILALLAIGKIVRETIDTMAAKVAPGVTTGELDAIGAAFLKKNGARSAPIVTYNYPGWTCISIDNEAAHGIPGDRVIKEGDLVKIDVSAEKDGYFADAAMTVPVPPVTAEKLRLVECAKEALEAGIAAARAGQPINAIGKATENVAKKYKFNVIRELPGHGLGKALHEKPSVPHFYLPRANFKLPEGLVITIEPHISTGAWKIYTDEHDGWTLRTTDQSPVAQFEHTIVIAKNAPLIVTA
jgi:methionyl aminopeptidase